MTCIVGVRGKNGVVLAADTQSSYDNENRIMRDAKTNQVSELIATAYTGYGRLGDLLEFGLGDLVDPGLGRDEKDWAVRDFIPYLAGVFDANGYLHRSIDNDVEHMGDSAFLLAVRNRLFVVESDFSVSEHKEPWDTMGSGMATAEGSLREAISELGDQIEFVPDEQLETIANNAVLVASNTNFVGGDITTVRTVRFTPEDKAFAAEILG